MEPEQSTGNIEYKLKLVDLDAEREESLLTQMKYRLGEGHGEALYCVGITDDGTPEGISEAELEETLKNLKKIANKLGADTTVVRKGIANNGFSADILIRTIPANRFPPELYICVLGNVDAGKSSLVGCLTTGKLDDGRGAARLFAFRHPHEIKSGRTSSVSMRHLGFDVHGNPIEQKVPSDEASLIRKCAKIITLIDLAGHEKYLRTTIFGVTGSQPDYSMLVVGGNMGVLPLTKEHMAISLSLKIPLFIVITKIDITPEHILNKTVNDLKKLLRLPGVDRVPFIIKDMDDVAVSVKNILYGRVVPIFFVSNVTGEGHDLLKSFLNLLPKRTIAEYAVERPLLAYVEETFAPQNVGTVLFIRIHEGKIKEGDEVFVGPVKGNFRKVKVRSIHRDRVPVKEAHAGEMVTIAIKGIDRSEVSPGAAVLSVDEDPVAVREFEADIYILHHSSTIRRGYETMVHVCTVREQCVIIALSKEPLRTGDAAHATFRLKYNWAYIRPGMRFIFREGRTRGFGIITAVQSSN
ncbi:MAG: GTP-binding protein [Candidatus Korarchaeota archaeon]